MSSNGRGLRKRTWLTVLIVVALVLFFYFDVHRALTLDALKQQQSALQNYYDANPLWAIVAYMSVYVATTALSLPGATILTLAGGALFGFVVATIAVSFASSIGATLAFLASRFLFRDFVQEKFADRLQRVNEGVRKEGVFYLFTLRLIPVIPFFVINLVLGLTPMRALRFYAVSQLGMLPATIVYVNAGTELAKIESLRDVLSPGVLISLAMLGLFPLVTKKLRDAVRNRRALRRYAKPKRFDYNVVVLGAGSAGLVSAYMCAALKAKVALIEKHRMGGDCLNTGCVPSKALIRSAKMLSYARRAQEFGFRHTHVEYEFGEVMERVRRMIDAVAPHDSVERYTAMGVDCVQGEARIVSPYEVRVGDRVLTARNIIIATGARPNIPSIPGIENVRVHSSDNVWELHECPRRLLVLGGGPIGCELAQSFRRLGAQVTIVQRSGRLLPGEDAEVAALVTQRIRDEGVDVRVQYTTLRFEVTNGQQALICATPDGQEARIEFDVALFAVGRKANVCGFGLEELGVRLTASGTIDIDAYARTNYPNIYACGDVAGPYQFTHVAAHQAWYCAVNALFAPFKRFAIDYRVIPRATFTDPEVARVGLNEQEAREKNIGFEVTTFPIEDLDRAIVDSEARGMVKVLTAPHSDKILGVTIVGSHAGDTIAEFVMAMKHGLGLNKILATIHIYPTLAEANKYVAGNWRKAHAPAIALRMLRRLHDWKRG